MPARRQIEQARTGAFAGAFLALPFLILLSLRHRIYEVGNPWHDVGEFLLLAPAPGVFFAFGKWLLAIPLNAAIWAASWVIFRSSRRHWSAVLALVITAGCWGIWWFASWVLGSGPD